jgi:putative flippase GtrA
LKLLEKFNIRNKKDFIAFLKHIIMYGIAGLISTVVSFSIYYSIIWINDDLYILAYTICFAVGVLVSYFLQNKYVFTKTEKGHKKTLIKAYISYGATYVLGTAAIYVMVEYLGVSSSVAPLFNIFITVPINYLLLKFWTFK